MKQLNIACDEEMYEGLEDFAQKQQSSLPEVVRNLIRNTLLVKKEAVTLTAPCEEGGVTCDKTWDFEGTVHRLGNNPHCLGSDIWWVVLSTSSLSRCFPTDSPNDFDLHQFIQHKEFTLKLNDGRKGMVHLRRAGFTPSEIFVIAVGVDELK